MVQLIYAARRRFSHEQQEYVEDVHERLRSLRSRGRLRPRPGVFASDSISKKLSRTASAVVVRK